MKLKELNEMVTSATLDGGTYWNETPSDVKDSQTHLPSKLPIDIPDEYKGKKKKKKNNTKFPVERVRINKYTDYFKD